MGTLTILSLWLITFVSSAFSTCDCGYTVNGTTTTNYAIFTDLFETDFLHLAVQPNLSTILAHPKLATGWEPEAYNTTPTEARGPYGKAAELSNILTNFLPEYTWGGVSGSIGPDPGLQLWVRSASNLLDLGSNEYAVQGSELDSTRDDILYASVRIGAKMPSVSGTCAASFWYRNNTAEIDIEYLSRETVNSSSPVNLVVQSPESEAAGFNAAFTPGFYEDLLPFNASAGYHEYRFDWLPGRIDFYADSVLIWTTTDFIPDGPGRLILNHWSNGDSGWSGGPPEEDAVVTISYVKAYFNSTNTTRTAQWSDACANAWMGQTCVIPDQTGSIDPTGSNGNVTGHTWFFSLQGEVDNQTIYPGAVPAMASANGVSITGLAVGAILGVTVAALLL